MKCPVCKSSKRVEIDLHSEGFSDGVYECGECSAVWSVTNDALKIIKGQVKNRQKVCTEFVCPTCHFMVSHETDLDAFQFHEELYECTMCGTVCSVAHNQVKIVKDSQKGSFLDSTGDVVESDDYNLMD